MNHTIDRGIGSAGWILDYVLKKDRKGATWCAVCSNGLCNGALSSTFAWFGRRQ